ncbi:MAG: O-antigen ligase family protein [Pyrinomonadaceae bacterium]
MSSPMQPELAIIGTRRQQRFAPVIRRAASYAKEEKVSSILVVAFFAAHVPLAILMSRSSTVATFHVLGTIAVGLWVAVSSEKIERVAYVGAYITGAEALWRMTQAQSFWEIGKYGVAATFIVAMIRRRRTNPSILPILYFVLLLPSVWLTVRNSSPDEWRQMLSSDLSGPFALLVAACFFSQMTVTREGLVRIFLVLIGPIIGVASLAFSGIAMREEITFGLGSNFQTSGGFGPNQVSSVLGLGALACFLLLLNKKVDSKLKLLLGGLIIILSAQSALTFSRGGLYNLAGAIFFASFYVLRDTRTRLRFVVAVAVVVGVSYFLVFPRLDTFTNGTLSTRFESTDPTGRDSIAMMDLDIWSKNPVLGVGPGKATEKRRQMGFEVTAHTEFTRLLAEHGTLGLVALLIFLAAMAHNLVKAKSAQQKALVVAFSSWTVLYMLGAGMRLVAPSFMFGLAFAHFALERDGSTPSTRIEAKRMPLRRLRRPELPQSPRISRQST